jgi:hypothetical protein
MPGSGSKDARLAGKTWSGTTVTERLNIAYPIVQGPLGGGGSTPPSSPPYRMPGAWAPTER